MTEDKLKEYNALNNKINRYKDALKKINSFHGGSLFLTNYDSQKVDIPDSLHEIILKLISTDFSITLDKLEQEFKDL